jgi:hypothetical protein
MTRILERRVKTLEDLNANLLDLDGLTATVADLNKASSAAAATDVGAVAGTGVTCTITHFSGYVELDFTLTAVAVTWTDAAGSGSSGSIKIFDLVAGAWQSLGCRTNLTITSDATLDPSGDLAGVFALGSVAANAGDGALTGTEVDFAATKAFTLSSNTLAVGTNLTAAGAAGVDGTATASDIYLNFSGSAATSDANGVLTVAGTISLRLIKLGDD